jgi:hypothetical protein
MNWGNVVKKTRSLRLVAKDGMALPADAVVLDGQQMSTKEEALQEVRSKLALPLGMGMNFDSLEECLQPSFWPERDRLLFYVRDANVLLQGAREEDMQTLIDIIEDTSAAWRQVRNGVEPFSIMLEV